ncbi:MAG: D-hexose-6-phosphate mutarotase [Kiritimatiellia bacterium]
MQIEALNQRWGVAGRIVFREGPNGVPVVVLAAPNGVCELSLKGGQVLSYRAKGFQNALWLSPLAEFAQGKPIRGGIPVCWPWFGKAPADFPTDTGAHGFARTAEWRVAGSEYGAADTSITLMLTEEDATSPAWQYRYQLKLTISVGDCLTLDLQTRNMDAVPFRYSECLHTYLSVADSAQVEVFGVEEQAVTFRDDVPHDVIYPKENGVVALRDPVMERVLGIVAEDASAIVVWHPALNNTLADVAPDGARRFVCIEPANAHQQGCSPITLAPGTAHTLSMRLQPTFIKEDSK